MAKTTAITDAYTKTQTLSEIAENTGLTKKDVANVVEEAPTEHCHPRHHDASVERPGNPRIHPLETPKRQDDSTVCARRSPDDPECGIPGRGWLRAENAQTSEIIAAIRAVVRGGSYFSPTAAREIVAQVRDPRPAGDQPFSILSGREREVLRLIAEGYAAKEIAVQLNISTKTVEAHRTSLMRTLGVRKATELVRYAVRHGLIEP